METSEAQHPRVLISYSHDSREHEDRVWALAERLRGDGVDVVIDQYEAFPKEGWIVWMKRQIRDARWVLMVCTETYQRRLEGEETPGVGLGVSYETQLIQQLLYNERGVNEKFVPVLFKPEDRRFLPLEWQRYRFYSLEPASGYEDLFRLLTDQPRRQLPELGRLRALPARPRRLDFQNVAWNVPYARNAYFTGREAFLDALHAALTGADAESVTQVITGLGGVGKTQTVVEYAYRHRYDYDAVLWTRADSRAALTTGFVEIARALGLPEADEPDQRRAVEAVKRCLGSTDRWLLIFDNVDTQELAQIVLDEFRPDNPQGRILLTSRVRRLRGLNIAPPLKLDEMAADEARDFLLARADSANADEPERTAAETLAQELGYLPLALEQAAAYILTNESRFQDYLVSYRKRALRLLEKRPPPAEYPHSVATTWDLNFAEVEKTPPSADLLRLSAYLSPDRIPFELITHNAAELGPALSEALTEVAEDPMLFDEVLEPLVRYSLIRRDNEASVYSIHRMVQAVLRDRFDETGRSLWAARAIAAIHRLFPLTSEERFDSPECERLLPCVQTCAAFADLWGRERPEAAQALTSAGYYLVQRGNFADAEQLLQQARSIETASLDSGSPNLARTLNYLGWALLKEGEFAEAEPFLRQSVAIREKAPGTENLDLIQSLNNLAALYHHQGRYEEAEPLYRRAQAILDQTPDTEAERYAIARSLNNLALLFEHRGRYAEAEPLYRRALEGLKRALGPENYLVGRCLNNLGWVCFQLGRVEEAEALLEQALAIQKKALRPEHPDTALSLSNLAVLYATTNRLDAAEPLFRQALAIRRKCLRSDHPDLASSLSNLAEIVMMQGRLDEAGPLFERAFAIAEKALRPEHPYFTDIVKSYSAWFQKMGQAEKAKDLEKRLSSPQPLP